MIRLSRPALVLAAFAAVLLACATPTQPPPGASGQEIYALQLCANCHGDQGEGKSLGPPLRDLDEHWTRESLAEFLRDPDPFEANDERIARLAEEYSGDMKTYANLSLAERLLLADYVLDM